MCWLLTIWGGGRILFQNLLTVLGIAMGVPSDTLSFATEAAVTLSLLWAAAMLRGTGLG